MRKETATCWGRRIKKAAGGLFLLACESLKTHAVEQVQLANSSQAKTCGKVHADSAHASKKNDARLDRQDNEILHRAHGNKPLPKAQKKANRQHSGVRHIVEGTLGLLELHPGLGKARHLGLEGNLAWAQLIAINHNPKTGMNISKKCAVWRIVASSGWA